jgi:hypothetical protein
VSVSKSFDKNLYVPRTLIYQQCLTSDVLKDLCSDEIVYNQQDYDTRSASENIHWLDQTGDDLRWIKSSRDISRILKHIDRSDEKTEEIGEYSMTDRSSKVSILCDVAGMGKSTVLNHIAQQLKTDHAEKWISKVDLNDYTSELDEVNPEDLKTSQQAIDFLIQNIFKLETDFELKLFKKSCESTGNVILLFDGFDEIASYYKDEVIQLIKSLLETKIEKIIIASRPEWAEYLEKEFLQIKYSLLQFSKENQESYLINFMKERIENIDADSLKKIVKTILKLMSESLSDRDYKFTGVPLITKLVAEFFESKVREFFKRSSKDLEVFLKELKNESFNLFKLYQYFVDKSLNIYFKDKCKNDQSNAEIKRINMRRRKRIMENYEQLAVQQILKTDLQEHLPSFKAKEMNADGFEDLVKIGLIYKVNNEWKFVHQTYGEFGFNKFLDHNFDDEECAKFILEVVLKDDSYQIIRTFTNFWIPEKINSKTCEIYQKKLLELKIKKEHGYHYNFNVNFKETPFHIAGFEGNENIFWFLFSSLTEKTEDFESKKTEIDFCLLKKLKFDSALFLYFKYCDDDLSILTRIKQKFGLDFIKKIFMEFKNILNQICRSDRNILKVLSFLRENFSADLAFLEKVFLTDYNDGNFLHLAFENLKNETLVKLFDELKLWKTVLGQDFVNKLILMISNYGEVFLVEFAESYYFDNDHLIIYLDRLKELCDEETLKEWFFFNTPDHFLFNFYENCRENKKNFDVLKILEWIHREIGKEFLIAVISKKPEDGCSFLHYFSRNESKDQLFLILKFLKHEVKLEDEMFLEEILFDRDENGESVFSNFFADPEDRESEFFELILNDLKLDEDLLKKHLIKSDFLLYSITQIKDKSSRDQILNLFKQKFGKRFFDENFYSHDILFKICEKFANSGKIFKYFKFVEEKKSLEILKNYISGKNFENQTILFKFSYYTGNFIKFLDWLQKKFDLDFLENFLLQVDKNGDSFLTLDNYSSFFTEIYNQFNSKLRENFCSKTFTD